MLEIHIMAKGHPLWTTLAEYARRSPWAAGPILARDMAENRFEPWERVLGLFVDGAPAGYCTLTARDELPEGHPFTPLIGFVFVDEAHRGRRYSLKLIERAMDYAGDLGYRSIYLMSGEKGLYEKYGFEKLGEYATIYDTVDQLFTRPIPVRRPNGALTAFLTSSPMAADGLALNPANGFAEALARALPEGPRTVFVCSDPDSPERTDHYAGEMRACLEASGIRPSIFTVLDGRNAADAPALVASSDLLILAGGHVPTQNRFFARIGLRALLSGYPGVVLGFSAGSMNSAGVVYAHPELPGEAVDPAFRRFMPGLGVTSAMMLPHYQEVQFDTLDGLRAIEDIALPDSLGRRFYALPDGSYIHCAAGRETLVGEAYLIEDGRVALLQRDGQAMAL